MGQTQDATSFSTGTPARPDTFSANDKGPRWPGALAHDAVAQ